MKTKFIHIATIFALMISINAYSQRTENRTVENFKEIKIGGAYDVFIKQGSSVEVRLEGSEQELEKVVTEVKDGMLKVYRQKGNWGNWGSNKSVKVYITYTSLEGLYASGASDIVVESTIQVDEFSMRCSGSGNIDASLAVNSLEASVSGSGDLDLKGDAQETNFRVSGSGDIDAGSLTSKNADLKISGSGNIQLHVTDNMAASVTGSGRIRYKGDPKQSVRITGSGSVRQY